MPSSKNYKRDYKQEYANDSKERRQFRSERTMARRELERQGKVHKGDGKDVDHRVPLSKGGSTGLANVRVVAASKNRSYARNKDGSMKGKK
jgi:5-methylcytosine-specific restriction endonuclease McrA